MDKLIRSDNQHGSVIHRYRCRLLTTATTTWLLLLIAASLRAQSVPDGFNPNANNIVRDIVVQPDGKILLSGNFTTLSPNGGGTVTRNYIARLNADGTLDPAFNPNANGVLYALALQPDGKILVGGLFTNIGGQPRNRIARLDPTTGLADSFDPNANGEIYSIAVQSNDKILAGGLFTNIGGTARKYIARLDPTTGLADSFDPSASSSVTSIVVQADGKILAGGAFNGPNSIGGQARNRIARLDPTTGLADSFDPSANNVVFALAVQGDGKVLAGGHFSGANSIGGQARNYIARLDPTTGLADSFDPNANDGLAAIAVQADGKILVSGLFNDHSSGAISMGGQARNYVARLDPTTGLADSFNPTPNNVVYAIAVQADGNILVGGNFTSFALNGGATAWRNRVARVIASGVTSTPTPAPTPTSNIPGFVPLGAMNWYRSGHTATRLGNGKVLILGGNSALQTINTAEIFDPIFQTFTSLWPTTMTSPRSSHTATLLPTGDVLITGGAGTSGYLNTTEHFDPITGQFGPLPPMVSARWGHTATLLQNGKVLIAGGRDAGSARDTAELFDPATMAFIPLPPMTSRRYEHTATLLPDGRVLIAGGSAYSGVLPDVITNTAELFDPVAGTFTSLAPNNMTRVRDNHTATLLPNGKVLIAGGYNGSVMTNAAELFDPSAGTFAPLPNAMTSLRSSHTATLLTNGEVLIAGGYNGTAASNTAELFRFASSTFASLPPMNSARWGHRATLLDNGSVLLTGNTQNPFIEEFFYPGGIILSGVISYCSNPNADPIQNVTLTLTDSVLGSTLSNSSGSYSFAGLASGGNYTVTPNKGARAPGSAGINTVDVVAIQRHFLVLGTPMTGCKLRAADVNDDANVNTVDVIAIQRFYLALSTGVANTGKYQFNPASRSYPAIVVDQPAQNYDALVFGDVVSPFAK